MTIEQKILKATLMLRRLGNKYQTKDEQICEFGKWYTSENENDLDEWIDWMRIELAKTEEEREEESRAFIDELSELEAKQLLRELQAERESYWNMHDEWYDYWNSRI